MAEEKNKQPESPITTVFIALFQLAAWLGAVIMRYNFKKSDCDVAHWQTTFKVFNTSNNDCMNRFAEPLARVTYEDVEFLDLLVWPFLIPVIVNILIALTTCSSYYSQFRFVLDKKSSNESYYDEDYRLFYVFKSSFNRVFTMPFMYISIIYLLETSSKWFLLVLLFYSISLTVIGASKGLNDFITISQMKVDAKVEPDDDDARKSKDSKEMKDMKKNNSFLRKTAKSTVAYSLVGFNIAGVLLLIVPIIQAALFHKDNPTRAPPPEIVGAYVLLLIDLLGYACLLVAAVVPLKPKSTKNAESSMGSDLWVLATPVNTVCMYIALPLVIKAVENKNLT
jgi:hypothetical protein